MQQTTVLPPANAPRANTTGIGIHKVYYYWGKIAFILLMLHAAYGLFESFKFLVFEYPHLNRQLQAHTITANEVTTIVASGVILLLATLITITMAWRLHTSTREEVANNFDLMLATIIIIATPFARRYLESLPWLGWIQLYF